MEERNICIDAERQRDGQTNRKEICEPLHVFPSKYFTRDTC